MDIEFRSGKLRKNCTDSEKAKKAYGVPRARKITQRLQEIQAASDLETLTQLRATGCHPLKGDRKGQFALELPDGFRLIFEPLDENGEAIRKEDFDYKSVRRVKIIDIKDYH